MTRPAAPLARRGTIVVVPCFNEAARLDVDEFSAHVALDPDVDFLFVDDGSTDGTLGVLHGLAARHPTRVGVLPLAENRGKAEAVRAGLQRAMAAGAEYVGFWDADLATPLDAIAAFRHTLVNRPECEWVIGSRVRLLGRDIERRLWRHLLGRVFATGASLVLDLPIYDTQCGAKLFRSSALLGEVLGAPFASRWIFDVELIARFRCAVGACASGRLCPIVELPLLSWQDVKGSRVTAGAFARAALELWRLDRRYQCRRLARGRARTVDARHRHVRPTAAVAGAAR